MQNFNYLVLQIYMASIILNKIICEIVGRALAHHQNNNVDIEVVAKLFFMFFFVCFFFYIILIFL